MKQRIRLTESQLHNIINNCVNEALTNLQYANLAGQADGALNTLGGKIKGFLNPAWKMRKERQRNRFAKASTSDARFDNNVVDADDEFGNGSAEVDNKRRSGYDVDYDKNDFTNDAVDSNSPYKIRSQQVNYGRTKDGRIDYDSYRYGSNHNQVMDRNEYMDNYKKRFDNEDAMYKDANFGSVNDVVSANLRLNNAYDNGRGAASGRYKGEGTGMNNRTFKRYGKKRD